MYEVESDSGAVAVYNGHWSELGLWVGGSRIGGLAMFEAL